MAKDKTTVRSRCPHACPLCAVYELQGALQEELAECVPPEVRDHLRRAAREVLLAVRALCEMSLDAMVEVPKPGSRRKPQRVSVED
jgi:hypothetical protein